jgi:anti-sigma regulatory factor (Ser/Thr protein kinase)
MAGRDAETRQQKQGVLLASTFDSTPSAPAQARRAIGEAIAGRDYGDDLLDDLLLVTSELVSNAVEHAHGSPHVLLRLEDGGLRLCVHDDGGGTPELRPAAPGSPRGRGLRLVDALATAWGTAEDERGRCVWARFSFDTAGS